MGVSISFCRFKNDPEKDIACANKAMGTNYTVEDLKAYDQLRGDYDQQSEHPLHKYFGCSARLKFMETFKKDMITEGDTLSGCSESKDLIRELLETFELDPAAAEIIPAVGWI